MFADAALARRIEGAEASLSSEIGRAVVDGGREPWAFVDELGGGVAVFAGAGSPVNKIIGVGFAGDPDPGRLADIEARLSERQADLQAEVATLASPEWHGVFGPRGYGLAGFENVLGLDLTGPGAGSGTSQTAPGVTVDGCAPADASAWLDVVASAFQHPDDVPAQAAGQDYPREAIERAFESFGATSGFRRYLARVDGAVAGGASMRVCDGVAQLCGAATLPPFRRRGVQSALLDLRLREARDVGCDIAVITTAPGSRSQQNAQRRGFVLLYARALHVRPFRVLPQAQRL